MLRCVDFVYVFLCVHLVLVVVVIRYDGVLFSVLVLCILCGLLFSVWVLWVVDRPFVWTSRMLVCQHWLSLYWRDF